MICIACCGKLCVHTSNRIHLDVLDGAGSRFGDYSVTGLGPVLLHRVDSCNWSGGPTCTGDETQVMLDAHTEAGFVVGTPFSTPGLYDFAQVCLHPLLCMRVHACLS